MFEEALNKERTAHSFIEQKYTEAKYMVEEVRQNYTLYIEKTDDNIRDLKREKADLQTEKQALLLRY